MLEHDGLIPIRDSDFFLLMVDEWSVSPDV